MGQRNKSLQRLMEPIQEAIVASNLKSETVAKLARIDASLVESVGSGSSPHLTLEQFARLVDALGLELHKVAKKKTPLSTTLAEIGLNCTSFEFQLHVVEFFQDSRQDKTVDDLLTDPLDATDFCVLFRQRLSELKLGDSATISKVQNHLILRALANARKANRLPRIYRPRRRTEGIESLLARLDISLSKEAFVELIQDSLASMYKNKTIDELLFYPNEALELCDFIRKKVRCEALSDSVILRALMNARKNINS